MSDKLTNLPLDVGAASPPDDAGQLSDATFAVVYDRLKSIASREISKDTAVTLNTTALVHELYERMAKLHGLDANGPRSFFAYAARAMRNILTDRARHRLAQKSGGNWLKVTVSDHHHELLVDEMAVDVIALHDALLKLAAEDERAAQVVELRYFSGLSVEQIAEVLEVNRRTVTRDWDFARAYLHTILK
jgi:RNA polymerase sigma factor (TIGR02999 family)